MKTSLFFAMFFACCLSAQAQVLSGNLPIQPDYEFLPTHVATANCCQVDSAFYGFKFDSSLSLDTLSNTCSRQVYVRRDSKIIAVIIYQPLSESRTIFARAQYLNLFGLTVHFKPWNLSIGFK